jgi:hypothetical protein
MSPGTFLVIGAILTWIVATGRAGEIMRAIRGAGQGSTGNPTGTTNGSHDPADARTGRDSGD